MNSKLLCANLGHCLSQLICPSHFTSLNGASDFVILLIYLLFLLIHFRDGSRIKGK
jgi:hypothetical protein